MEDAHAVHLSLDNQHTALFGVFDGHAGKEVAAYCATHIVSHDTRQHSPLP
jgi:serine/threonine protein phosphatase PrpC